MQVLKTLIYRQIYCQAFKIVPPHASVENSYSSFYFFLFYKKTKQILRLFLEQYFVLPSNKTKDL